MASPFDFFRKRQAGMMVVMVILSMLLFTLDALFTQQGANFWLLGLLLGGAVFGVAGVGSGKWLSWGIGGAALGAALGLILPGFVVSPGAIPTGIGVIEPDELNDFQEQRVIANRFVGLAAEEALGQGASRFARQFGFNQRTSQEDLLFGRLMEEEADALGIVVTNAMVNDYLKMETGDKLTREAFAKVRTSMTYQRRPLDEETLYDILRRQIKARMAYSTLLPTGSVSPPTPDVYWEYFRRMNVRQQIHLAALDVDAFLDGVPEPADAEIAEAFAAARTRFPNEDEPGSLGFHLPGRARVAWVEVDYDTVEASVGEITNEEIEVFYNKNRETRYQIPVLSDDGKDDAQNADSTDDDDASDENADAPDDDAASEDSDESEEATEEATDEVSATDAADTDAIEADNNETGEADAENKDPLIIPKAPEDTDDADTKTDAPVKYEYRELDDALKDEIRDELLQRKTRDAIENKMQAAIVKMTELAGQRGTHRSAIVAGDPDRYEQLVGPDSDAVAADLRTELAKFTPELLADLKTWAEENGFTYFETPFLTYDEFRNGDDYPLGTAVEPGQTSFSMSGSTDAARRIYSSFGREAANNDTQLFLPYRAVSQPDVDEGTEVHYAYWAVAFSEPHIPTLDEPGIRDRVILALKRQKARDILKQRADALVAEVKEGLTKEGEDRESIAAVLESKTITGESDAATLQVRESQPFSWLRTSQTSPTSFGQQPRVEISRIRFDDGQPPLDDIGQDFFETVFEDMDDEDVAVVPNFDRTRYFIVHVTNRFPTPEVGTDGLLNRFGREGQLSFLNSPMTMVMRNDLVGPAVMEWERSIWRKYDVLPDAPIQ